MADFRLHGEYSKQEAGAVVGLTYGEPAWRKGIFWYGPRENALLFVTLAKEDLPFEYQYADRFVSASIFHWQSQTQNPRDGETGRKLSNHEEDGRDVHLFVRSRAGQAFVYLGTCTFRAWLGDRPFTVWWELHDPVPEGLHVRFAVPPPPDVPLDAAEPKYQEILASEVALAEGISSRLAQREFDAPDTWGLVRQRVGGKIFRREVLENFGGACCVDGINLRDLLDAAHIRAWSQAPEARLDPANGIALCALHHRAFDTGLMHFEPGGKIAIADPVRISRNESTVLHLNRFHGESIRPWLRFPTYLHSTA